MEILCNNSTSVMLVERLDIINRNIQNNTNWLINTIFYILRVSIDILRISAPITVLKKEFHTNY